MLNIALPEDANGQTVDTAPALGTSFVVAYDASTASASAMSAYAGSQEVVVRVVTTTAAFLTSAVTPTALSDGTHHYCPAGVAQDLRIPVAHKLAFIKAASAGNAYVTVLK